VEIEQTLNFGLFVFLSLSVCPLSEQPLSPFSLEAAFAKELFMEGFPRVDVPRIPVMLFFRFPASIQHFE